MKPFQNVYIIFTLTLLYLCLTAEQEAFRRILPETLVIREGEDMQLRHTEKLKDETSCYVRTPMRIDCNLKATKVRTKFGECNNRIKYWTVNGECGVFVKNVSKYDIGMWRITSKNGTNNKLVDATYVEVLDKIQPTEVQRFIWTDLSYILMFENTDNYCIVKSPTEKAPIIIKEVCNVELESVSMIYDGNWLATVAMIGQIHEIVQEIELTISSEHIESGYKWYDTTTLHLYCNVVANEKEIKICRFYNSAMNETGLRLKDGLRSDKYGYYGNGLMNGECGLTIYELEEEDYGLWYCSVILNKKTMFTRSIWISNASTEYFSDSVPYDYIEAWSITPVFTAISKDLELKCFSNVPLAYCWFLQPNNETLRTLSLSDKEDTNKLLNYTYDNTELSSGTCIVKIKDVDDKSSGTWTCNMGPITPGAEISTKIVVRVAATPLAAINKNISAKIGDTVALECKTVPRPIVINYCRFYSPGGFGINVNEAITEDNSFLLNGISYWFSGKSLKSGDCGLVISKVSLEHIGEWTCAALLEREKNYESFDTINVFAGTNDIEHITAAAATGISIGIMIIVGAIVILIMFVKRKFNGSLNVLALWREYQQERGPRNVYLSSQPPTPPEVESHSD